MIKIKFKPCSAGINEYGYKLTDESFDNWKKYMGKIIKEGRCFVYKYPDTHRALNLKFPKPIGKVFKLDFTSGKADVEFVRGFDTSIFNEVMLTSEKTFIDSLICCTVNEANEIIPPISCMGFYLHLP